MSLSSPLVIIGLIFAAAGVTQIYFVMPEIEKGSFDIAASQWFVFCPLYLFVKRKWTMVHLKSGQQFLLDCGLTVVVHTSLAWIALSAPNELMVRVLFVWLLCAVLSVVIFRTGKMTT